MSVVVESVHDRQKMGFCFSVLKTDSYLFLPFLPLLGPLFQFFTAPRLTEAEGILVPGAFSIHPPDVPDLPFYSGSVTMFVVKVKDSEEDRVSHYVLVRVDVLCSCHSAVCV